MSSKRDVLSQLSRDELVAVVERFELQVADRRKRDDLLEAVAASKKATLIERLLGTGKAAEGAKPEPAAKRNGKTVEAVDLAPGERLTREKLEGYLWSAADILRDSIDSSDYKNYILGLLFLKRLSDRFEEECEALQGNRHADPEDPDEHDFFVPRRARWAELQKTATNLGEALNKACAALEDSNPKTLEGVLGGIDYNDERRLGDSRKRPGAAA